MATNKSTSDFILDILSDLGNIRIRPMMGEYLLYYKDILFGGIYDNQVLIKKCDDNKKYNMKEKIPYKGAKPMYVADIDNLSELEEIIIITSNSFKKE